MATTSLPPPGTPTKRIDSTTINLKIKTIVESLSFNWDLRLKTPDPSESPEKRSKTAEEECVAKIIFLCWKHAIDPVLGRFRTEADILYSGWVHKPKAKRGLLPKATRQTPRPVTPEERQQLLHCLLGNLTQDYDRIKMESGSPWSVRRRAMDLVDAHSSLGLPDFPRLPAMDDSPLPFSLTSKSKGDPKRRSDGESESTFKKPKLPGPPSTRAPFRRAYSVNSNPPLSSGNLPRRRSVDTSFESNASSVFSIGEPSMLINTQSTEADDSFPAFSKQNIQGAADDQAQSSEFGGSFDPDLVGLNFSTAPSSPDLIDLTSRISEDLIDLESRNPNDAESEMAEDELQSRLQAQLDDTKVQFAEEKLWEGLSGIFPEMPSSLRSAPLCVTYEITRVFLYAGVPLTEIGFPELSNMNDYDALWRFLKNLPILKGMPFPERCGREVWASALDDYRRGFRGVMLAGSLRFNNSAITGPFFRFQLEPMKLDLSHRLGRRYGNDRFLEIDIPHLTGRHIPRTLSDLGDRGREIIVEWLVDGKHQFLGRLWKPFHTKAKDRIRRDRKQDAAEDPETAHRLYFFAVDGNGFRDKMSPFPDVRDAVVHSPISIKSLLNSIRPTRKNTSELFLKLFTRTSLAVSRNSATIILPRSQLRFRRDITCGSEVMTEGAGRISPTLALKVAQKLGLSHPPSGLQGRIGEAKGLWVVDHNDKGGEDWIEIYESQQKWKRSTKPNGESDDPSHRTFEVLKCSGPLKSADLNLQFLPLLVDRAKDPRLMTKAIAELLEQGLTLEMATLQTAMENPQSFRKWVRENNGNIKERLKTGVVLYRAGLPATLEERLNLLLDAGFDPRELHFLKEMARTAFKSKCDELKKRLNITVSRSTYAYMIPDFWDVLEPNEVYIDFSSFVDEVSGFSGVLLNNKEVLVARSPAHLVSDIQKVKAVFKVELMGLKDVIVFSTKGNPSLASKLSGGDYDGDIAWVCWEPSLVDNFMNAEVPELPDLVEEGFLRKDSTTYAELIEGCPDPDSRFLQKSLLFNMQQSFLGIGTIYKEHVSYTLGTVNTLALVYMSKLLGDLVDQFKQGYIFTEGDWTRFKETVVKTIPRQPRYKTGYLDANATHIVDHLMFVADKTIQASLTEFHQSLPDPPAWDDDLVTFYKWAKDKAVRETQWDTLIKDLDKDIEVVKSAWTKHFSRAPNDESKPEFVSFAVRCYEDFQAIRPHIDTPLTQSLLPDCLPDPELSQWALLKASAVFGSYSRRYVSNFVWWMAGKQLAQLKATYTRGMVPVAPHMYAMLKPDATFVKRLRSEDSDPLAGINDGVSNVEELESLADD